MGGSPASKGSKGSGVPIFVGSGAHSHAQARGASMGPPQPASSRRSQTPQTTHSQLQEAVLPPPTTREIEQARPVTTHGRKGHTRENGATPGQRIPERGLSQGPADNATEGEVAESNGKGKARAAPRRPGKPPSAYVLFSQQVRPRIAHEAGTAEGASFSITARVRQEWLALPNEERARFEAEATEKKQVWESVMDEWRAQHTDAAADDAPRKRRTGSRQTAASEPVAPTMDAFQLFQQAQDGMTEDECGEAWDALPDEERTHYTLLAQEAEEKYLADLEVWEQDQGKGQKRPREKPRTVSDDEADYLVELDTYGPALKARRIDSRKTAMADLSSASFKHGRASKRTFDMERKLKAVARERQQLLKEQRAARGKEESTQPAGSGKREQAFSSEHRHEPEEEIIDEGDEGEDGDGGAESDAESVGATSVASSHHPLRDNRFTVRTRIVNGQIVLDESSLQQQRSNDASMDGVGQEYVDVNESDRFVNSATYSKRVGTERWDAHETGQFLRAVSMWGSDFEMISRMFPNRNRKQIRAKWRSLERTDSRSLDLAFRRKLPVDLEEYGILAGVDLSGEAPSIQAQVIKKAEGEGEGEGDGEDVDEGQEDRPVERDENGLEIVDEGEEVRKVIRKKSATPIRLAKSKSPSAVQTDDEDDDEQLPTMEEAMRTDSAQSASRKERAQSTSSATAPHRPRSASAAATHAAEVERLRLEKKQQDLQRKERERARRRSVPTNEEEVID